MKNVLDVINTLKSKWAVPMRANHRGVETFFLLNCEFDSDVGSLKDFPMTLPDDLIGFWSITRSATLFKDVEFGQWGLELLSPESSLETTKEESTVRPEDFKTTDLIVGKFLGDSDLLLVSCEKETFGKIRVALPIDRRSEWPEVANNFTDFLIKYSLSEGDKYWEVNS